MATSASIDNSLQGEWIPSQMPRMGLNRDNRDNRKDCPEGVIANALVMRGILQKHHYFDP